MTTPHQVYIDRKHIEAVREVLSQLSWRQILIAIPAAGLLLGLALLWTEQAGASAVVWTIFTAPVLLLLLFDIVRSLRRGEIGLDIVAALSMTAALVFGEELAAIVLALMYAGGQNLESFAEGRARREMTALLGSSSRAALNFSAAAAWNFFRNSRVPTVES